MRGIITYQGGPTNWRGILSNKLVTLLSHCAIRVASHYVLSWPVCTLMMSLRMEMPTLLIWPHGFLQGPILISSSGEDTFAAALRRRRRRVAVSSELDFNFGISSPSIRISSTPIEATHVRRLAEARNQLCAQNLSHRLEYISVKIRIESTPRICIPLSTTGGQVIYICQRSNLNCSVHTVACVATDWVLKGRRAIRGRERGSASLAVRMDDEESGGEVVVFV